MLYNIPISHQTVKYDIKTALILTYNIKIGAVFML